MENSAPRNTRPHAQRKLHHLRLISLSCTAFAKFPTAKSRARSRGESMRRADHSPCYERYLLWALLTMGTTHYVHEATTCGVPITLLAMSATCYGHYLL